MIDWRAIDTVLLDMDGTLLDLHFDSHFWLEHLPRRYVELHRLDDATQEEVRARIIASRGLWTGTAWLTGVVSSGSTSWRSSARSNT